MLSRAVSDAVKTAVGAEHRSDPIAPRTGGPAGNARMTAWLGLLLLVGFVIECGTLLSLHSLLSQHIFIGAFLVPLVLLKTASTGWRVVRYYSGSLTYRKAGPPPLLLRLLGPLVVLTGLAVLGSGLALIPLGQDSFSPLFTVAGHALDPLTIHKLCFVLWFGVTAVHVLGRAIPAVQLTVGAAHPLPGRAVRGLVVAATLGLAVATGAVVLNLSSDWTSGQLHRTFDNDLRHDG